MTATRDGAGLVVFVPLAFSATWLVAASVRLLGVDVAQVDLGARLLAATALYALTTAWPPLVALWIVRRFVEPPPSRLDLALRPSSRGHAMLAVLAPLALTLLTTLVVCAYRGAPDWLVPEAEGERSPTLLRSLLVIVSFAATLLLVWMQSFAEEIGWRGFVLVRAMQRFGAWRGLWLHGALWGLWYAPVVFLGAVGTSGAHALERVVSAMLTCLLLGTLLGWLRIASGSITTTVVANSVLTLAAGAPYLVAGLDAGARGAILEPVGAVVLGVLVLGLVLSRERAGLRVPPGRLAQPVGGDPRLH